MNEILQYLAQGLAIGSFYALAALGLAVIFGVLGVVNFAHGAVYMLGAVTAAVAVVGDEGPHAARGPAGGHVELGLAEPQQQPGDRQHRDRQHQGAAERL